MKKLLLLSVALLWCFAAMAVEGLTVTTKSGTTATFLYVDKPEVTFPRGKVVITSEGSDPATFEIDDVAEIKLDTEAGVDCVEAAAGISFSIDGEGLHFYNVPAGARAIVANIAGVVILDRTVEYGLLTIGRDIFQKGVYIVRVGDFTTKVTF